MLRADGSTAGRLGFIAFLLGMWLTLTGEAPGCAAGPGSRIVLASDAVDPDVFVWDSRTRLIEYSAGQWGRTRDIFAHTLLAEPGTLAIVVACTPGIAHPKFSTGDQDAVGVKILSGPYRGRFGWVLSSDEHRTPAPASARADASHQ